jgi:hypothetical protein
VSCKAEGDERQDSEVWVATPMSEVLLWSALKPPLPFASSTPREHVDQYAPMAFGMVLAYLQPEQVCRQLHMCPQPSLAAQMLESLSSMLKPSNKLGELLMQGRPMAPLAARHRKGKEGRAGDALVLPQAL